MSITLANADVVQQGGSTVETDPQAAVMHMELDYTLGSPYVTFRSQAGTVSGLSLVPGTVEGATPISVRVDCTTGNWTASSGQSGTLGTSALTSLLNTLKTLRNTAESFLTANSIVAGTQVSW